MIPSFEHRHSAGYRLVARSWGAVAGAAIGAVGSMAASDGGSSGGGAGSQTASKEPWAAAAPWLRSNITQGQNLQTSYTNAPFNAQQQNAYGNMANQGQYMRAIVPSLLGQMQGNQLGFDPSKPNARPDAFNWNGTGSGAMGAQGGSAGSTGAGGLLGLLNASPAVNSSMQPMMPTQPAPAGPSKFTDTTMDSNFLPNNFRNPGVLDKLNYKPGGYGAFVYGDTPEPGTQADQDRRMYLLLGGKDPKGLYSGVLGGWGGDTGIGSGADGDGAGPGGAGATW